MGTFIQLVIDGLSAGSIYAALALAIVLVNQATGLINFAQGGMAVLAAYFAYSFIQWGVPLILAILLSILVSFVLGALIERFLMRRFEQGDPDTAVVVTIGLLTLITGLCGWIWSFNNLQFPSLFPVQNVNILGAVVSIRSIGTTLVIVGIMILLQLLFIGTKLGLALRAVAVNPQSAAFSGLPVGRLLMVGWGLAAGLGAIAGALIAPSQTLTPGMMDAALVYALAAVILGGMSSPIGVVLAAWMIGVLENLVGYYLSPAYKEGVALVVFLLVILFRPEGLLGRTEERKV